MPFVKIVCKLGNMRKEAGWVVYPIKEPHIRLIQCDKRIAEINLATGKGILSSGKGGHNGFMHLNKVLWISTCLPKSSNS